MKSNDTHNEEIQLNKQYWEKKPVLRRIYAEFYEKIAAHLKRAPQEVTVEIGSGIGNLKSVVPDCIRTDMFDNPWLDQVENAYHLSFADSSVDNLVLFDVWHHLQYPGTVLSEFYRVLKPNGRVIIFDPDMSLLGLVAYGLFHHEPLGLKKEISWDMPASTNFTELAYYAAQGNANRVFVGKEKENLPRNWNQIHAQRMASLAYVASGGYSKPQLYPSILYPFLKAVDKACSLLPSVFSVRLLVVLEKRS